MVVMKLLFYRLFSYSNALMTILFFYLPTTVLKKLIPYSIKLNFERLRTADLLMLKIYKTYVK